MEKQAVHKIDHLIWTWVAFFTWRYVYEIIINTSLRVNDTKHVSLTIEL